VLICANRAEANWRKARVGVREQAVAIQLRGIGHELAGDYVDAIKAHREAVGLLHQLNEESEELASGLNLLANVEVVSRDFDTAKSDYNKALQILRIIDSQEGIATCTGISPCSR